MNPDSINVTTETDKTELSEDKSTTPFITMDGMPYKITEEGSLGLLAMGYAGIMLWRDKKYSPPVRAENETQNPSL